MSFKTRYDFESLVNESERLVIEELERQLVETETRYSENAILDMAAYALNHVQPMYRANLLGRLYASALESEAGPAVRKAVSDAIKKVSQNPPE
ncbi:MAG: competence protein ComFB [Spirochaetaceae bacterium]|nr:MAG: competence protein ComFB [Spirochaetaceae bacterium]